jgi:hypothetical protein
MAEDEGGGYDRNKERWLCAYVMLSVLKDQDRTDQVTGLHRLGH